MNPSIIARSLLVSLIALSFAGCGGGGNGGDASATPALKTGVFLDSAVEGLNYRTATQSGVTEAAGIFRYLDGETITFFIGETVIGQTAAKERITPVDLVSGASDETHPKVTNICRLLQSLDRDGVPENGIQIPQQIHNVLINHPVDLNLSTVEFETSSAVKNLFGELNRQVFTDQGERVLCAVDQARTHFRETLRSLATGTQRPGMKTFATAFELEAYLKEQYASRVLSSPVYQGDMESQLAGVTAAASMGETAANYSSTTIQEAGVDESDTVKTDGTYLYIAGNRKMIILKALPADAMVKTATVDISGTVNSLQLYNKIVIVLYTPADGGGNIWLPAPGMGGLRVGMPYWIPVKAQTGILLIDVSNPANPQIKKDAVIDGMLVSSRLTAGKLHVIQQFLPNLPPLKLWYDGTEKDRADTMAANMRALSSLTLKDLTPGVQITDNQGKHAGAMLVAPENFYCPDESGGGSTVTVTTLNLDDPTYPLQSVGVAADAHTVYATTGSLYLSAGQRNYMPGPLRTDVPATTEETVIHKFDLSGLKAQSMGSGRVPGTLLNQFSMGEFEGVLRVATTTGYLWGNPPTSANHVYCLKSGTEGLEVIGKLENLAPGERIYSARFVGKRGFLVTFVQIDPLFTLDLSDPAAPRVAGMLKVPGYSDYIHPLDENHLITIGKDVKLENGMAWYQGVQLSMFDITDFANPKLLHKELIGVRGTESEALHNPKAFTFWNEKKLLAFPIQLNEYQKPPAAASDSGARTFIGLYGYRVSVEKGFEPLGRVPTVMADTANPYFPYYYYAWMRGQFIGDWVYAVQPDSVSAARIDDISGTVTRVTIDN